MKKFWFLKVQLLLSVLSVLLIPACVNTPTAPSPELVPGVYIQSGFEFYRWEEGLALMLWHDGIGSSDCESRTNPTSFSVKCHAISEDHHCFEWYLETMDGETASFSINDQLFDLADGTLFVIKSSEEDLDVTQMCRDLSEVVANTEDVIEFGLSDSTVRDFIQSQAHITGCISSYYISHESSIEKDVQSAREALIKFFSDLHAGEYERAVYIYGGEYSIMIDHNPELDPEDHAGLLRNACTINGAQCLEVRRATFLDQPSPTEFRFAVEFSNDDGSLFTLGPCCEDSFSEGSHQTEFIYTSGLECTNEYRVMEPPVYLP